jgi:hypothetical protein
MDTPTTDRTLRTPESHEVQDLLREQADSGLNLAAFARERGINTWKLYKANRKARPVSKPTFDPVTILAGGAAPPAFELELGGGLVLRIPHDFDECILRRLVGVLVSC